MPQDFIRTTQQDEISYEFQLFKEAMSLTNGNLPLTIIIVFVFMQIRANKKTETDLHERLSKIEEKLKDKD